MAGSSPARPEPIRTPRNGLGLLDPLGLRCETRRTRIGIMPSTNCPLSRIDSCLHLQTVRSRLVVLHMHTASLDIGLDLEAARRRLVVLQINPASLDAGLYLQSPRRRLVVLHFHPAGLDAALDLE